MKYPWPGSTEENLSSKARPLSGTELAADLKAHLRVRLEQLAAHGIRPGLATILVGDDPGSQIYVAAKHRDCSEIGLASRDIRLPVDTGQEALEAVIQELNDDPTCTGMIVQLPLPNHLDTERILHAVSPAKDADGLHPYNLGLLVEDVSGKSTAPQPCTPRGVLALLQAGGVELDGARVCVVGRGLTAGRPLGLMLTQRNIGATAVLCHTGTRDLAAELRSADVIVAAAGVPGLVGPRDVKPGAAVVDVGVSRRDGRIVGDVAPGVEDVAGWLTPNPGGVGPMTRVMLLENVVAAAEALASDASGRS